MGMSLDKVPACPVSQSLGPFVHMPGPVVLFVREYIDPSASAGGGDGGDVHRVEDDNPWRDTRWVCLC